MMVHYDKTWRQRMRRSLKFQIPLLILFFFFTGCAPIDIPKSAYTWTPKVIPAEGVIDANVRLEAKHEMAPEIADMWRKWLNTEQNIIYWKEAVAEAIHEDMRRSGIFSNITTSADTNYNFLVKIKSRESQPKNFWFHITIDLIDPGSNTAVLSYKREADLGNSAFGYAPNLRNAIANQLADIRTQMLADFSGTNSPGYLAFLSPSKKQEIARAIRVGSGQATLRDISQDRPSIFLAHPKDDQQVAEETVPLLGYVTSLNKTQKLKLFINKQRQFVDEMWSNNPIVTTGLRGYPLDLAIPLELGKNTIEIQVLDQEGFMASQTVAVTRIELQESRSASIANLPPRAPDLEEQQRSANVTQENFMEVIGGWVKQTAVSDYNKGNRMYDAGRLERAAYYYQKAIKTNPFGQAFFNLGLSQLGLNQDEQARLAFAKACELGEQRGCQQP